MLSKENISPARRRPRVPHEQWLEHINRCHQSKMSHEEYCQKYGLALSGFKRHHWRGRRDNELSTTGVGGFVPVELLDNRATTNTSYEFLFPRGVLLKIPTSEPLSSIVKSLRGYL